MADFSPFASRWAVEWVLDEPDRRVRTVDGVLLFLDISGFTAMSEKLAKLGREGAEELREVINQTFEMLLGIAYVQGGSLLKFGGDALLLLYTGEDAAVRACHVAHEMRTALRDANPVPTSQGGVDLGMTVGVAEGDLDLVLVGDDHRELFVLGPAATAVIEVEAQAERGQVLVSDAVAARLPTDCLGERVGPDATELATAPSMGKPPGIPPVKREVPEAARLVSAAVRDGVRGGASGEHRHATVAFIHFEGTDLIRATQGPEALADAMHELVVAVQQACHAHDICFLASDIDADGGKIILTAGVPTGDDTDDTRMLHACRRIIEAQRRIHVRIGVNRGPVYAGVVGPFYRLTYTILGDAVNLAARVMAKAEEDRLLATAVVANRSRTLFDIRPLEPFHVKGKTQPVQAIEMGREVGVRLRLRRDDTGFVGRAAELDRLLADLDGAAQAPGYAAALVGPAGIGKSRLIDELQERRPDVDFHLVACSRFGAERPYRAAAMLLRLVLTGERHGPGSDVIDAARSLAAGDPRILPYLPLLGPVYEVGVEDTPQTRDLDPAFRGEHIRDTIGRLLGLAVPGAACLVVEDAQWLDPESRSMLDALGGELVERRPWLVLLTSREPQGLPASFETIPVGPLHDDAARRFVLEAIDRGDLALDALEPVVARAGGNPLFLAELVRGGTEGELPDSIEALFHRRLDSLDPGDRLTLSYGAVLGLEFPPDLMDSVCMSDPDADPSRLSHLGDFVTRMRTGYWRFTETMYQEVAYSTLPFKRRRQLHRQAATALRGLTGRGGKVPVEALSRHDHLGGDHRSSWESSRAAFEVARQRSAMETAASFARRALEASRYVPELDALERTRLREDLGDVLELAGAFPKADEAFRAARKGSPAGWEPRLCRKIGRIQERAGHYSNALRWYSKGLKAAGDAEELEAERILLLTQRCITLLRLGRGEEASRLGTYVSRQADRLGADDLRGRIAWVLAWAHSDMGYSDVADRHRAVAIEAMESSSDLEGLAFVHNGVGTVAYNEGRWDEAARAYDLSHGFLDRLGDRVHGAVAQANHGDLLSEQGHLERAHDLLESAVATFVAARHSIGMIYAWGSLGRNLSRMGRFVEARAMLERALAEAEASGATGMVNDMRTRLAELALFEDDPEAALRTAKQVLGSAAIEGAPLIHSFAARVAGLAAHAIGDPEVDRLLGLAAEIAAKGRFAFEAALAASARAHVTGDPVPAEVADRLAGMGVVADPISIVLGPVALAPSGT